MTPSAASPRSPEGPAARLSLWARIVRRLLRLLITGPGTPLAQQRTSLSRVTIIPLPRGARYSALDLGGVPSLRSVPKKGLTDRHLLHIHGGGWAMGSARTHIGMATRLGLRCGATTTVLSYHLAPEHPYPMPINEVVSAYDALLGEAAPDRIVLTGDSAGAGGVVAALVQLRDSGYPLPSCGVMFSPWTDLTSSGESIEEFAGLDPMIDSRSLVEMAGYYAGGLPLSDPRLSPLFADLAGLPPMFIQAGAREALLSDSTRLAQRATAAGVAVDLHVAAGLWHDFPALSPLFPETLQALDRAAAFIVRHVGDRAAATRPTS